MPGCIGSKSVKWLTRIVIRDEDSRNHYQQDDFKLFLPKDIYVPDTFGEKRIELEYDKPSTIMNYNVQSFITNLFDGDILQYGKPFVIKGVAYSCNKIIRVEVSTDGGERWDPARIVQTEATAGERNDNSGNWAWVFWEYDFTLKMNELVISVRAWDSCMNVQPNEPYWNSNGYMNNSIFKILVKAQKNEDPLKKNKDNKLI